MSPRKLASSCDRLLFRSIDLDFVDDSFYSSGVAGRHDICDMLVSRTAICLDNDSLIFISLLSLCQKFSQFSRRDNLVLHSDDTRLIDRDHQVIGSTR